jgi:hypothetical protein
MDSYRRTRRGHRRLLWSWPGGTLSGYCWVT